MSSVASRGSLIMYYLRCRIYNDSTMQRGDTLDGYYAGNAVSLDRCASKRGSLCMHGALVNECCTNAAREIKSNPQAPVEE